MIALYDRLAVWMSRLGDDLLPLLSRFVFAAVLLAYFISSGMTKLGTGVLGFLSPSSGAYVQIFPRAMEAAGYDTSQLPFVYTLVVIAGTVAEFVLPVMIVVGLFTRFAGLGMIGFIVVQSLTDLIGHGGLAHVETVGRWFDTSSDGLILDQRSFWIVALLILVAKGGGWLSLDRLVRARLVRSA